MARSAPASVDWSPWRGLAALPTLLVLTLVAFWAVSPPVRTPPPAPGVAPPRPRFVNLNPASVERLAGAAALNVARHGPRWRRSALELVRLGGASLPHVLPLLDGLPPDGRGRLAQALIPIAVRMGLLRAEEPMQESDAVLFWTRFWTDRAVEFRQASVRRSVRRFAHRGSPGRFEEVLQMDTFALPALVERLPTDSDPASRQRAARLLRLIHHSAPETLQLHGVASGRNLRDVRHGVRRWWRVHRGEFTVVDGADRIVAGVSDTGYGHWFVGAIQDRLGVDGLGRPVAPRLARLGPVTFTELLASLALAYSLAVALAAWEVMGPRKGRPIATGIFVLLAALPAVALFAAWHDGRPGARVAVVVAGASVGVVALWRHGCVRLALARSSPVRQLERGTGMGPLAITLRSLQEDLAPKVALLGTVVPSVFGVLLVAEAVFQVGGLGEGLVAAIRRQDIEWLMALTLVSGVLTAVSKNLGDAVLSWTDPRFHRGRRGRAS